MNKDQMLDLIIDLQKRLQLAEERIRKLESPQAPYVSIPSVWGIVDGTCQHEYPNPWFATVPPNCKKCGQQAPSYTVTCQSSNCS